MSQKETVLRHLKNGKTLSVAQARNCFRIGNVREVVRRLREEGNAIYLNERNGRRFYRLGTPRKSTIANSYRQNGASAFE